MRDIHESFYGTRVFHAYITADKWYRVLQFFKKNHRSISPDYKLCIDILKMCISKYCAKKISDSIAVALKEIHGRSVTASNVRNNSQNLHDFIFSNQAYLFITNIPGSPIYWQKFMYEVVAMVKQLGIPTWFMTLSCADLRWNETF